MSAWVPDSPCCLWQSVFFRELIGKGSILSEFDLLLGGEPMRGLVLVDGGWLLAILPPGAFFSLALAVALKNHLDRKRSAARRATMPRSLGQSGRTP